MGVPRLSRWMMERCPQAVRTATRDNMRGRINNFYVDFNGLIHESLLRAATVHLPTSELELFYQISSYLNEVVLTAAPTHKVYLAIDGPAPDAKIRQQRLRRIMGQLTSESQTLLRQRQGWHETYQKLNQLLEDYVYQDGSASPVSTATITPGTCFMRRLTSYLTIYLAQVIEQKQWGNIEITLSGANVEGEGEHKIINEIKKNAFTPNSQFTYNSKFELKQVKMVQPAKKSSLKFTDEKLEAASKETETIEISMDEEQEIVLPQLQNNQTIESNCVFGMDGDLFLLLLGLNRPECYILRRWQGIMVEDFNTPQTSKYDPWNVGLVYVDVQLMRETIIYEFLQKYIDSDDRFIELVRSLEQNELTRYYIKLQESAQKADELTVMQTPPQLKSNLLEYLLFSQVANRLINDFVALTLFVGNDFIPEVPGQSIKNGALDKLIDFYKNNFLQAVPFKCLLTPDFKLSTEYFGEMFRIIGDNCEPLHIADDIEKFRDLHKFVQNENQRKSIDQTGNWALLINREMKEMREELGELADKVKRGMVAKLAYAQKTKLTQYFRKMYYLKFQDLNSDYIVNPPISVTKTDLKKLAMLDQLENLQEAKIQKPYSQQLEEFVKEDGRVNFYYGFHRVVRSYLKTLQWVILYYLTPEGIPQWNWEYPYPFTPLCSDMSVYCKLYSQESLDETPDTEQVEPAEKVDDEDSGVENLVQVKQTKQMTNVDLFETVLQDYKGPEFKFTKNQPKSQLLQILFTLDKSKTHQFLPEFVLNKIPKEFFDQQPKFNEVVVLDYSSAFKSFTTYLNLTQKQPSSTKGFGVALGYGFSSYSVFYKNYPVGLVDGVHFELISHKVLYQDMKEEEKKYYDAVYARGEEIHFSAFQTNGQFKNKQIIAGPGSIMSFVQDNFDIDYSKKYRCPNYKENKHLNIDCNPTKLALDQSPVKKLQTCFIFVDKNQEIVKTHLYIKFTPYTVTNIPEKSKVLPQPYRGPHLLTENFSSLVCERRKLNVVAAEVNGQTMTANINQPMEPTVQIANIYNLDNQVPEVDQYLSEFNVLASKGSSNLPQKLIDTLTNYLEISEQRLMQAPLMTYLNDYQGVIYGIVYDAQIYVRSTQKSALSGFVNRTNELTEDFNKFKRSDKKSPFASFFEAVNKTVDEFCVMNQSISYPDREIILLMAPITFVNNKPQISSQIDKSYSGDILYRRVQAWKQYLRSDLVPFEFLSLQPVPLASLHRKTQRQRFIRTLYTNFQAQQQESVSCVKNVISHKHSDQEFTYKLEISQDYFNLKLTKEQKRELALQINPLSMETLNKSLKQYKTNIDNFALGVLFESLKLSFSDNSYRELGLQISKSNLYKTPTGEYNKLAEFALILYINAFPELLIPIISELKKEKKRALEVNSVFGVLSARSEFKEVSLTHNIHKLPVFGHRMPSEPELSAQMSLMQYYVHSVISPLVWQTNISDENHVPNALIKILENKLETQVQQISIEPVKEQNKQNAEKIEALSLVYVKQFKCVGIVISVGQNFVRVVCNRQGLMNYNSGYRNHKIFVGRFDEVYPLGKKINYETEYAECQKMIVDNVSLTGMSGLQIDLNTNQQEWPCKEIESDVEDVMDIINKQEDQKVQDIQDIVIEIETEKEKKTEKKEEAVISIEWE
ncbi:5'-3'_exoribonuclease [Hexamita inflata]|uniref:5'-3' exoribonuclease n=1 Tax=Hexamita inflata TaxID=28002 RepID=A0AA86UV36_9EUKA|nr:5'-3' exoribonuclease [Hexamita inflata]